MNKWEEKYGDQLLELLAGDLPEADARSLHAQMAEQPELQAVFDQYARLDSALVNIGQVNRQRSPRIDILGDVMGMLPVREEVPVDSEVPDPADVMAYIDGSRDDLAVARLRKRMEVDPALRQEVAALGTIHENLMSFGSAAQRRAPVVNIVSDVMRRLPDAAREHGADNTDFLLVESALESLGKHVRNTTPEVDLRADVMRAVTQSRNLDKKVSDLNRRARDRHQAKLRARNWMMGVAAAALVLVMLSVWLLSPGGPYAAQPANDQFAAMREQSNVLRESLRVRRAAHQESSLTSAGGWRRTNGGDEVAPDAGTLPEEVEVPVAQIPRISLREAQELRRQALINEMKRDEFARVASLTPEEALAVLSQRPITPAAVLGATQFLAPEDAIAVLEEAIAQNPDNAYLRAALASRHSELEQLEAQLADLDSWSGLDPENGLPLFQKADALFAAGDYAGAMDALMAASERPYASPYALETARFHQAALEANGVDNAVARYFAASGAGSEEYGQLTALQQRLLAQGAALEAAGDYEGAADVYDAVRDLGHQVTTAATLPNVMQAGYEIELSAVDLLAGIPEVLTPETLNVLTTVVDSLWRGLTDAIDWSLALNNALNSTDAETLENAVIRLLNGEGI